MIIVYLIKIILSIVLGFFVGIDRQSSKKHAGYRDICLVYLGATLVSMMALELTKLPELSITHVRFDVGRLFAYCVVSLGFLCSGVILQHKNKLEGITTAVTLWASAISGLFIGIGNYPLAIVSAIGIFFILKLKHIRIKIIGRNKKRR